jgi:hypothetical protein
MDVLNWRNAQYTLGTLNDSLASTDVLEVAGSALVSPSLLASFNQALCNHHVWACLAAVAWVCRAQAQHRMHEPANPVDRIGQRVAAALWTPNILVRAQLLVLLCEVLMTTAG